MATQVPGDRPNSYRLQHFRIDRFRSTATYSPPARDMSGAASPDRNVHGPWLENQLVTAFERAHTLLGARDVAAQAGSAGVYLEVKSAEAGRLPDLTWQSQGIRLGALRVDADARQVGSLFVPATAEGFLTEKLREYAHESTPTQLPKHQVRFAQLDRVQAGSIETVWTDVRPIPNTQEQIWWECWCWADRAGTLVEFARRRNLLVSDRRLHFPDYEVIPVFGDRSDIVALLQNTNAIEELRRASDTPSFFMTPARRQQPMWVNDLVTRVRAPLDTHPRVCILDNGIASAHPLLSPAIRPEDCHTVNSEWGVDDHSPSGHGTNMAGCVLYGDLTSALADQRRVDLSARLESVKFLAPRGFPATDPLAYGSITQHAIRLPEETDIVSRRVFCMAVTNEDVSGERPSSWSAALDQACAGCMPTDGEEDESQRLVFVSAGNIDDSSDPDEISDPDEFPIEDPAQAWNSIAIGGFTEKVELVPYDNLPGWRSVADAGDISPYSRISTDWTHALTPIKPELVFEAGNRAINETSTEVIAGVDSLSLLTTSRDFLQHPLTTFWATSPATAQAAGMAAAIMVEHPDFWPETIRALLVHSAEWTPTMLARLRACNAKKDRVALVRSFGYGVPRLDRALNSARNDLALVAQSTIYPFKRERKVDGADRAVLGDPTFNEVHFYTLPWPREVLEQLGETHVRLKVVLSYFVEPSPGDSAPVAPSRYQSYGLRFELKRRTDTSEVFRKRINKLERVVGDELPAAEADPRWMFGSKHVAAGSLHSDVWTGPAVDLAARNVLAVYPTSGWWKNRKSLRRYDSPGRYGLVLSISTDEQSVDLYAEIQQLVQVNVEPEIAIEIDGSQSF